MKSSRVLTSFEAVRGLVLRLTLHLRNLFGCVVAGIALLAAVLFVLALFSLIFSSSSSSSSSHLFACVVRRVGINIYINV